MQMFKIGSQGLYQPGSVEFSSSPWEGMDTVLVRFPSVCISSWINIVEGQQYRDSAVEYEAGTLHGSWWEEKVVRS